MAYGHRLIDKTQHGNGPLMTWRFCEAPEDLPAPTHPCRHGGMESTGLIGVCNPERMQLFTHLEARAKVGRHGAARTRINGRRFWDACTDVPSAGPDVAPGASKFLNRHEIFRINPLEG
jgi:hypothetical protein